MFVIPNLYKCIYPVISDWFRNAGSVALEGGESFFIFL